MTHPLEALQRRRRGDRLATGGAIVALRQRGYRWADLADALGLADQEEARRLAVEYLLAADAQRGADEPRSPADAHAAKDDERAPPATG